MATLPPEASQAFQEALEAVVARAGLGVSEREALQQHADALWTRSAERLTKAAAEGAQAELDAQLADLTACLASQRENAPEAARGALAAQHEQHARRLEQLIASARADEEKAGAEPPPANAAVIAQLEHLAQRHAGVLDEVQRAGGELDTAAASAAEQSRQLEYASQVEARVCPTQEAIVGAAAKRIPTAGLRTAQGRAVLLMQQR